MNMLNKDKVFDRIQLQKALGDFVRSILEANEDGRVRSVEGHAGIARTTEVGDDWEYHIADGSRSWTIQIAPFKDLEKRIEEDRAKRRT